MTTIRPRPTAARRRLFAQVAVLVGPIAAAGLVRGALGSTGYPMIAAFGIGAGIGLVIVLAVFGAIHLLWIRNFRVDIGPGTIAVTNVLGQTKRWPGSRLRLVLTRSRTMMVGGAVETTYAFFLDSAGRVLVGLSGLFFEEAVVRMAADTAGIPVEGGWSESDARTWDEITSWRPGIGRWRTLRSALAIPVGFVVFAPAVALTVVQSLR